MVNMWSLRTYYMFELSEHLHLRQGHNSNHHDLNLLFSSQEGILAYKVINATYLLNDFLNHGEVRHQIQLRNICELWIPLYTATQSQLFVRYIAINTWNGLSGDLRSSSSLCTFKNKLRQLYLSLTLFSNIRS